MKIILLVRTFLSTLFGAKTQDTDTMKILNPEDYNKAITASNVQLVDVRTAKEFDAGAIANAINIDFFKVDSFNNEFNKLDKEQPVYLYCRSGNRSQQSAKKLDSLGFKKIYDLQGGYMGWPYKN
ncbi:MAG: rhodanese-like domain-containing protein [Patiriisocius sp.]|uniref:rhodanese-like domain-containing protein n=1 Tax=Patiriisocius sp. TaxID=2822396 RepID=UPI003EF1EF9E